MKKLFIYGVLAISFLNTIQAQVVIKETETHSIFKGVFFKVWSKLKSLNPKQKQSARSNTVYTAGIRGAEATDTLIQPYWKDDLTQDPEFQKELEAFYMAQTKMDQGELKQAITAFDQFTRQYQSSSLLPNALIAKGLSEAVSGQQQSAKISLKAFIDSYPQHPLHKEAVEVLADLP